MPSAVKRVNVKRVYEKPARGDGYRVLVDRLWPRGLKKERGCAACMVARYCSLGRVAAVVSRSSRRVGYIP